MDVFIEDIKYLRIASEEAIEAYEDHVKFMDLLERIRGRDDD